MAITHFNDLAEGSVTRSLISTHVKKLIFLSAACGLYKHITGNAVNFKHLNDELSIAKNERALYVPAKLATLMLPTTFGYTRFDPTEIAETAPTWLQYATTKAMTDDLRQAIRIATE